MPRSTQSSSAACRWSRCCTARWSAAGSNWPAACHIRVAERVAYYGLPEGQRGIFVGGGGSVRIPRLIGVARMTDMMLTGRVYDADEGERAGLAQYVVADGEGLAKGFALAAQDRRQRAAVELRGDARAAAHRRPVAAGEGLFTESLMAAIGRAARPRPRTACAPSSKGAPARSRSHERRDARTATAAACGGSPSTASRRDAVPTAALVLRSTEPLGWFPERLTDRLVHWAAERARPHASSPSARPRRGDWRRISYAQMLQRAQRDRQALLDRGLSAERPVAILSRQRPRAPARWRWARM